MNHWKTQIDRILTDSMTVIADRFERGGYPFIDTKFDIVSGRDFGENDEPFRRKDNHGHRKQRDPGILERKAERFT